MIRTSENDLFLDEDPVQKVKQDKGVKFNRHMTKEYKLHKKFHITQKEKVFLYLSQIGGRFGSCIQNCCFPKSFGYKRKIFQQVFDESEKRIDQTLDLVQIIKNIRASKILLENSLMNP